MDLFTNNINLVLKQSTEIGKKKKQKLDKNKLESLAIQKNIKQTINDELIHNVENKDTSIPLIHYQKEKSKQFKKKNTINKIKKKKLLLKDKYKGNFLDLKE